MALSDNLLNTILPISDNVLRENLKVLSTIDKKLTEFAVKYRLRLEKLFSQNLTFKGLLRLEVLLWHNGNFLPFIFSKLKLSNKIIKRITFCHKGMSEFESSSLFDIFCDAKEASLDVSIIKGRLDLLRKYKRFLNIWRKGVISPSEVSQIFKIEGPKLGQVIRRCKKEEFERKIITKRDAVKLIRTILHNISYQTYSLNKNC